ncbi:unnamed protein product, partial [Ectocarpus sp. 13 AM-2016]
FNASFGLLLWLYLALVVSVLCCVLTERARNCNNTRTISTCSVEVELHRFVTAGSKEIHSDTGTSTRENWKDSIFSAQIFLPFFLAVVVRILLQSYSTSISESKTNRTGLHTKNVRNGVKRLDLLFLSLG